MRILKYSFVTIFLPFYLIFPALARADYTEVYNDSITTSISNAGGSSAVSSSWLAADGTIVTIPSTPGTGGAFGLTYNSSGELIVRTANNSNNFKNDYVGEANYKIFGPATTSATFVTTGNDFTKFYDGNKTASTTNLNLIQLIERGLGINTAAIPPSVYTPHNVIVEFAVDPNNNTIMRPTKDPDIRDYAGTKTAYGNSNTLYPFTKPDDMSQTVYDNFKAFYTQWVNKAYTQPTTSDSFPFTQLGYTYFWGNTYGTYPPTALSSKDQGLSEFILLGQTPVSIYAIYSTASYIYTRNKNGAFSSDSDAEYGNGFASFNITGDCNTVWAGHSFQNNVSRDALSPNTITLASGTTMSGGEGILIWSLNYTVNNSGTISGATAAKFKVADTDNIAILFEGDTSTLYGTPILTGKNILTNSGRVSSTGTLTYPGIAVYVANGDTDITNTGTIASYDSLATSYGIWLKTGTNTITNSGTIGTITGEGDSGTGIRIDGANTTITNNVGGSIYGNTYAIRLTGGTNTITNYGNITSAGTAIQIDSGTATLTNSGGTIGNIVVANDTAAALNIGNKALTITGDYTQNANATLILTANSSADFGSLTANNVSNASSKTSVIVGGYLPNSTTFSNVINGTGVSVPGAISSSSPVFTFAGNLSDAHVNLTATRANSYQSFASSSNTAADGSVLNTLAANNTASGDMITVLGAMDSLTSAGQINNALNSLLPNTDNSSPGTTQETLDQFLSTVFAHLDAVKNVTSDALKGMDAWASGYGSYIHQDPMATSNGYNATIWGMALGYDLPALDHLRVGLSGGFAQDFVRSKDSSAKTNIDSYQATLYGSYAKDAYYIDTALSFAYNTYDASRHIAVATLDRTATGDYGGQQYSAYIGGGYKFTAKNIELTPLASFQYSHLRLDSYTESGAGAADLKVSSQDYDAAQTGLGMKIGYPFNLKGVPGRFTPELKFKWLYDWVGDAQQTTSTFTGGGGSFGTRSSTPAQSSYDLGAKLTLEAVNFTTISLNYDLEVKEDFYGHYGLAEVRYRF